MERESESNRVIKGVIVYNFILCIMYGTKAAFVLEHNYFEFIYNVYASRFIIDLTTHFYYCICMKF